jgi:ribosomal protein S18 acetylase RimI-like enzyme
MHIRPYRSTDLPALCALTVDAFQGVSIDQNIEKQHGVVHGHDWRWRKAQHIEEDVAANPEGVFVAEDHGTVLGYVTTLVDQEAGIGQIPNLAVSAGARNRGLGKLLIEHALGYFRARGLRLARIETLDQNPIGQYLYPACGFREVARQIHYAVDLDATRVSQNSKPDQGSSEAES